MKEQLIIKIDGVLLQDWDGILIGDWDMTQTPIVIPKTDVEEKEPEEDQ